jgi:peptidyl-prolyl cis-trans isomerase SurA
MHKFFFAAIILVFISGGAYSQVVFTYGKDSVTVADFLKAYQKNNAPGSKERYTINDYLDLYISSRLKIKEAKALGYDTLPQMIADLQNLREQIIPAYMSDEQGIKKLMDEAFNRSQTDIHIAHIFISYTHNGLYDSAAAQKRAGDAYAKLMKGESFPKVAVEYSDDPSVKTNGGDVGFITAFTLPYELENLAYSTPAGKISTLYHSKAGIHIFKNLGERKDPGTIKMAEILLAFPPDADTQSKNAIKKLADSLYTRIIIGDDFGKLAATFSNDVVSAASQGMIAEFGTGQYDPGFEAAAFALTKDGAVSKPFLTTHGWHIIKRISRTPVNKDPGNTAAAETLREKVESSDRINSTRASLLKKITAQTGIHKTAVNFNSLWAYTDSVLNFKTPSTPTGITASTTLFTISNQNFTAVNWIEYARSFRYKSDGSGIKPMNVLWDEFTDNSTLNYYKDNLEKFSPAFKAQIEEFKDGNLFFEIMQRKIWGPAQADTIALENYFNAHRSKYKWNKSADAVVFYSGDATVAGKAYHELQKEPKKWKDIVSVYEDKLAADSNRFELDQLPGIDKEMPKSGSFTHVIENTSDKTVSFAYIIKLYPEASPRSFSEAKGLAVNDYQAELEIKWVNELRAKYPVTINQSVLLDLIKKNELK